MLSSKLKILEKKMNNELKKTIKQQEKEINEKLKKIVINTKTKRHRCQGYCKIKTYNKTSHVFRKCTKYANKNKTFCEDHNNNTKGIPIPIDKLFY